MRTLICLLLAILVAAIFGGCSAIPGTQPIVTMPVALHDQAFTASGNGVFTKNHIDLTGDETWQQHAGDLVGFEGVSLTMSATNTTGSATDPGEAGLRYYVSDRVDLAPTTITAAAPLLTANLPATAGAIRYDSGLLPVTDDAAQIIRKGVFTLYILGDPEDIALHLTRVKMQLKMRTSIF